MAEEKPDNSKERIYFRGLHNANYGLMEVMKQMRDLPRVIKAKDLPPRDVTGPQYFNRWLMEPAMGRMQSIQSHMVDLVPGGRSQRHGHMNEAVFYILDGKGYDIHDGERYDYEAGDIVVVRNGCVHQHFNSDPKRPLKALVVKSKPMYLFTNLLFQTVVEKAPGEAPAGFEGWDAEDF